MASLTLITLTVLAMLVQTCKSEIPGLHAYPLEQNQILANVPPQEYSGHNVVFVPVCSHHCAQSPSPHQSPTHSCQQQEYDLPLQQYGQNLHQQSGYVGGHQLGNAAVHQQITQHGTQHQQTIHHHGSGRSHQSFQQEHQQQVQQGYDLHSGKSEEFHQKGQNVNYKFEYSVNDHKTGDVKLHREERRGDVVTGEYSVLEEDGNVRTVKYYADWKTGFHAQVHNSKHKSVG